MKNVTLAALAVASLTSPAVPQGPPADGRVALSSLDVSRAIQTWGSPRKDASVTGAPLRIGGRTFSGGFGTHSFSRLFVRLDGRAARFVASVGLNDGTGGTGSVEFKLIGDGKSLWSSGVLRTGDAPKPLSVDVAGVRHLTLEVTDGGDGLANDHAVWADARFQGVTGPISVVERLPEHAGKVVPGAPWQDVDGKPIQAHGGGILLHEGRYYWYGEDRSNGYVAVGVSAYVSDDLVNWKHLGVVLPASAYNEKWKERTIAERPKVVFNPRTRKFVLWFHYDRSGYGDSRAGVAVADRPEGPFRYLGAHRPVEKSTYRDMNLFVDDDGAAYALYAGEENYTMHVVRLDADWTAPERPMVEGKTWIRTLIRGHREAPAPFKHRGRYYLITSAATGWNPNPASYAVADSVLGEWKPVANPFVGSGREITFGSQSTFVLTAPGRPDAFVYLGDRWNPQNLADARYVWLPFTMKPDGTFEVSWQDEWEPKEWGFPAPSLTYRLREGAEGWPADKRGAVVAAMDAAVALYNRLGVFAKRVTAGYNPGTPTADGNYNGSIRFGGQINTRVALHELGHTLGIGTHPKWRSLIVDGKWTGPHALAQLRAFDGPDAVLHADRQHFWPYGLNFDRESSPENDRRHVLMVAAFRRDLGIVGP